MTYEVTPADFGFPTWLNVLLGLGTLTCIALAMYILQLIWPSHAWSWWELVPSLLTWLVLEFSWYFRTHYSLEVDDNSVRVVGGRVVRKGHLRYVR
jgi:hypothetical protein